MILTFVLRRRSALKVLGPVIDAAQRRKHIAFLCLLEEPKEPFLPGDFDRWGLLNASYTYGQVFGTSIGLATDDLVDVGVSSWFDNTLRPYADGARVQCYLSDFHKQLHAQNFPLDQQVIARQPVVGWTMADHRALSLAIPESLSRKLPIQIWETYSGERQYLQPWHILFTLKRRVPEPWRRSVRGRAWYLEKVVGAWHQAKEAGLPLVIKTRRKHGDPWWLRLFGRVVGDEQMYPATSLQLLAGASLCHHFMSGAHAEARLMNVPVLNYRVPMTHVDGLPGYDLSYAMTMRGAEVSREQYGIALWGGYDDCKAGERVMDIVEAL